MQCFREQAGCQTAYSAGEAIQPAARLEIEESARQFSRAWSMFAKNSRDGAVLERPGMLIADSGVTWPAMNAAFVTRPVDDSRAFAAQLQHAIEHFAARGREFMVVLTPDQIAPEVRESLEQELASLRFVPALQLEGMVADALQPPSHQRPSLEIRPVADEHTRLAIAELNAVAYEIPRDWAVEALAVPELWTDEITGYVGYIKDRAVTCAAVLLIESVLYVALVATLPEHRGRGLAESVMRFALHSARLRDGGERSILHSTPAGINLYKQMGYRFVTSFTLYIRDESATA